MLVLVLVLVRDIIIYLVDCPNIKFRTYHTIPVHNIPNIKFPCEMQMKSLITVTNIVTRKVDIYHHGVACIAHMEFFTVDAHFAEQ